MFRLSIGPFIYLSMEMGGSLEVVACIVQRRSRFKLIGPEEGRSSTFCWLTPTSPATEVSSALLQEILTVEDLANITPWIDLQPPVDVRCFSSFLIPIVEARRRFYLAHTYVTAWRHRAPVLSYFVLNKMRTCLTVFGPSTHGFFDTSEGTPYNVLAESVTPPRVTSSQTPHPFFTQ